MFSDKICQLCYNDLEVFGQFRKDLILKQNALYRAAAQKHPEIVSNLFKVKSEINEFIDCNPTESLVDDEELFNPQCIIKSEGNELEQEDYLTEINDKSWNKSSEAGPEKIKNL